MKRILVLTIIIMALAVIVGGCSGREGSATSDRTFIDEILDNTGDSGSTEVIIVPDSTSEPLVVSADDDREIIRTIIDIYCGNFLSYSDSPLSNLDSIKDIVTDEYEKSIQDIMGYNSDDDDYSQAVAVNKLYYSESPEATDQVEVACLCYQNTIINESSNTISTFYIFKVVRDPDRGWLINSVDKYRDIIGG